MIVYVLLLFYITAGSQPNFTALGGEYTTRAQCQARAKVLLAMPPPVLHVVSASYACLSSIKGETT